jgi:integrase/recombinase XerC
LPGITPKPLRFSKTDAPGIHSVRGFTGRPRALFLKAFGNWACREGYPVEPAMLRVRAPKVAQKEMESFAPKQIEIVLHEAGAGWPRIAVEILLGTGMRVGELCALALEDVEDDGDATFLKIKRGKGAKFRRVPVSRQLRAAAHWPTCLRPK